MFDKLAMRRPDRVVTDLRGLSSLVEGDTRMKTHGLRFPLVLIAAGWPHHGSMVTLSSWPDTNKRAWLGEFIEASQRVYVAEAHELPTRA